MQRRNITRYTRGNRWSNTSAGSCENLIHKYYRNNNAGTYVYLGNQSYMIGDYLANGYLNNHGHIPNIQLNVRYGYQCINNSLIHQDSIGGEFWSIM